uniref:Uncharacterized protein n=1 Tax=Ditylum brightwellii TaxID=49249 RepID=A0A7S4VNW5_9STRA
MFDSSKWTLIASGSAESVDSGAVTSPFSVEVPSGEVQAFYIHGISRSIISQDGGGSSTSVVYKSDDNIEIRTGDVYKSDENMEIRTGRGLYSGGVFSTGYGEAFFRVVYLVEDMVPITGQIPIFRGCLIC